MRTIKLDTVATYNNLYGLEALHPLVTVVNLNQATSMINHITMEYGLYALYLKNGVNCQLKYGRKNYDYQEGTITSFAPGQVVELEMNIELLLGYCLRFYERQFTTRELENQNVIQKFEFLIDEYLDSCMPQKQGLPSVSYFADKVFLTANYFGDLVKRETGKSAQEYIQFKLIEKAKDRIVGTNLTMSEIAYELGFQYPQHFGRLFKRQVGVTPNDYRKQN